MSNIKKYSKLHDGNKKLSVNFKVSEFACNDGTDSIYIDTDLVDILQAIRNLTKASVIITSAYRTDDYNRKVGGVNGSYHTLGRAADIYSSKYDENVISKICQLLGGGGVGLYTSQHFTHVDTRVGHSYWHTDKFTSNRSTFVDEQTVRKVQELLLYCFKRSKQKSYDCGKVDGVIGTKTIKAFVYFCNKNRTQKKKMLKLLGGE